jgi:hypothetical protein
MPDIIMALVLYRTSAPRQHLLANLFTLHRRFIYRRNEPAQDENKAIEFPCLFIPPLGSIFESLQL